MSESSDYRDPPRPRDRPFAYRGRAGDGTVKCGECGDTFWVEVGVETTGTPTVRPCSRCRPETFERWARDFPGGAPRPPRRHEPVMPPEPYTPPVPEQQEAF